MTFPYTLPRLPYPSSALEPNLNRATIMTHHDQIFAGHVEKLNHALQPYPALHRRPLPQLLLHPDRLPCPIRADVLEHGGAVYNHALYFPSLAPARSTKPDAALAAAIARCFGSMEDFLRSLRKISLSNRREGYAWLLSDKCGKLRLLLTPGQSTALPLAPIVCLDLYRHAYYLTYGDDRPAYVEAVLPLMNWDTLSRRYAAVFAGQPPFPNP